MSITDLEAKMSARRADLSSSPSDAGPNTSGSIEVIPPADGATGEILPVAAATAPAGPVVPADPEPQFPLTPPKVLGGLPYARSYMKLAQTIHQTEMVPKDFQGRPDAIMAAMMYGYELGLGPMQALSGINVIQGRPSMSAELMRALITEAGHMFILAQTDEIATVRTRRKDWPDDEPTVEFSWTLGDAKKAGLVEWYEKWTKTERGHNRKLVWNPHGGEEMPQWVQDNLFQRSAAWANYTRAMLGARVTSEAARALFADVLAGMSYTPEEVREFNGGVAEAPLEQEVPQSPSPATPQLEESAADGPSAEPTPPEPPATAQPSVEPAKKATRARGATKKAAPAESTPTSTDPPISTAPSTGPELVPTEAGAGSPLTPADAEGTSPDSDQPTLDGTFPPAAPAAPEAAETGTNADLRRSLSRLLDGLPTVQQPLCRSFLAQHFPGRGAVDLNGEELTLALNIAGGWPQSADQYRPPGPEQAAF